ncbi:hypothetical protein A3F66_06690 [candidate division TM6 bacterium RIFCSPHIGHO2_12_FULL_32_22]|nr:MAG: hypothetical protein A3F66_06690 [candidate division TM6 bacterium RIFCSPHIGHO2_12_FULL_32_22]
MGKIVAIGGGGFGGSKNNVAIDNEIVLLSGKTRPNLLFIPTASMDDEKYIQDIKNKFGNLNCKVDVLYLISKQTERKEIKNKIENADIIYVGGGNTLRMMNLWRRLGVDKLLINAYKKNKVMSGVSAGAICWFSQGNSDARKFKNLNAKLIKVTGLGIIKALCCPHYDSEKDRRPALKNMMLKSNGIAIAIEDNCAIQIVNNKFRIISSKSNANAYRVYWKQNKFYEELIEQKNEFLDLNQLISCE